MTWYLNPALTGFRAAVDTAYPYRDRASDGTIGDTAHAARDSDHNPDADGSVDAWDMDVELHGAGEPYASDVERLKIVFQNHESSSYWIHDDQIAFRAHSWEREDYAKYAGIDRNRHTRHVHWNTRESHEDSTAAWKVAPVSSENLDWMADHYRASHYRVEAIVDGTDPVDLHRPDGRTEPNRLHKRLSDLDSAAANILQKLDAIPAEEPNVDVTLPDEQIAILADLVAERLVRALREIRFVAESPA